MASSTSSGTASRTSRMPGTASIVWRAMTARAFAPVKGGWPVSISKPTHPRL